MVFGAPILLQPAFLINGTNSLWKLHPFPRDGTMKRLKSRGNNVLGQMLSFCPSIYKCAFLKRLASNSYIYIYILLRSSLPPILKNKMLRPKFWHRTRGLEARPTKKKRNLGVERIVMYRRYLDHTLQFFDVLSPFLRSIWFDSCCKIR